MIEPPNASAVADILRIAADHDIPWTVVGAGSNLLVLDGGIEGIVLRIGDALSHLAVEGNVIRCEAGAPLAAVARLAAEHSLAGLEMLSEIPGTIGGALYMNAGAYGQQISDTFASALLADPVSGLSEVGPEELALSYRSSVLQDSPRVVCGITLCMRSIQDSNRLFAAMEEKRALRASKYPQEWPNCGSVFKRVPDEVALAFQETHNGQTPHPGYLIESSGLKGERRGGCVISEKHANFIINTGGGTAADFLALMRLAQERVEEMYGIRLVPEVRIVGRDRN
jgi:UDP-N-acetylmuramate dehydrogenase